MIVVFCTCCGRQLPSDIGAGEPCPFCAKAAALELLGLLMLQAQESPTCLPRGFDMQVVDDSVVYAA